MNEINVHDYPVIQENGQRICGPPLSWIGQPPGKHTEVYISRLPINFMENELLPLFSRVGHIYTLRLMMKFAGCTKGYGFVQYANTEQAQLAVENLNGFEIAFKKKIIVKKSVDNCRLFIGNIPKSLSKDEIKGVLDRKVDGVSDIVLYMMPFNKEMNRGFCFTEFETHRYAALARRTLLNESNGLFAPAESVKIDWAIPEDNVDAENMDKVRIMFLRNLSKDISEIDIRQILHALVDDQEITRIRKVRHFCFVHFKSRKITEDAISYLNGMVIKNCKISAALSIPPIFGKLKRNMTESIKLCNSLEDEKLSVNTINDIYSDQTSAGGSSVSSFQNNSPTNSSQLDSYFPWLCTLDESMIGLKQFTIPALRILMPIDKLTVITKLLNLFPAAEALRQFLFSLGYSVIFSNHAEIKHAQVLHFSMMSIENDFMFQQFQFTISVHSNFESANNASAYAFIRAYISKTI